MSYIIEPLRHLAVPIDDLVLDPVNARIHGDRNLDAIVASLERFGQRVPIVVQRQGMIVRAGNGRLLAALRLGWGEIAAIIVDEADAEATAYAVADNRSAELAVWDLTRLAETLSTLADADGIDLSTLGFNELELEDILADAAAIAGANPDDEPIGGQPTPPDAFPEINPDTLAVNQLCPRCGYEWSDGKA